MRDNSVWCISAWGAQTVADAFNDFISEEWVSCLRFAHEECATIWDKDNSGQERIGAGNNNR